MRGPLMNRMTDRPFVWRLVILTSVALVCAGAPCRGAEPATEAQIENSIEKAKAYLLENIQKTRIDLSSIGVTALLKAGVKPTNPIIQEALDEMAARCSEGTFDPPQKRTANYVATCFIMAFANSDPERYEKEIQILADYLAAGQRSTGGWDYPSQPGADEMGDTSQTQYAMLGLWEASMAGATVDLPGFGRTARWHAARQAGDGGFAYRPGDTTNNYHRTTHSMTAAGVGSLCICRMFLYPSNKGGSPISEETSAEKKQREAARKKFGVLEDPDAVEAELEKEAVRKSKPRGPIIPDSTLTKGIGGGLRWLAGNYEIEKPTGWPYYYLYSLERAMALAELDDKLGDHSWYLDGASHLVRQQLPTGGWTGQAGAVPTTAFGLMFLTRATHKTLGRRRPAKRIGGGLLAGGRGLPKDLSAITSIEDGTVKQRKISGPVDELLSVLEDPQNANFFEAQEALVEKVVLEDPKALVGKTDKLLKLATVKNDEVRRTAMWALGRSQDITVVPTLIQALSDPNLDTMVEARNALRFLSKRIDGYGLPNQPTDKERQQAIARWKEWYLTVRPYDERDDLLSAEE